MLDGATQRALDARVLAALDKLYKIPGTLNLQQQAAALREYLTTAGADTASAQGYVDAFESAARSAIARASGGAPARPPSSPGTVATVPVPVPAGLPLAQQAAPSVPWKPILIGGAIALAAWWFLLRRSDEG